jgi:subtilisin family serine protease
MPTGFQGGYLPGAGLQWDGHERAAIDPDDFTGGFAVWSGTSFAAPVLAGRLAAALEPALPAAGEPAAAARDRAWQALEALTPLRHR